MGFTILDRDNWKREEYFQAYYAETPCTYSLTTDLDITSLRNQSVKLYPAMLYSITTVVNRHEEFRTAMDSSGRVGIFDSVNPSYTVFHKQSETFSSLWTEYEEDYSRFYHHYCEDALQYGQLEKRIAKPVVSDNLINISCIPWTSFTGFNLNLEKGYRYLLPIFTIGRFRQEGEKYWLPLSIQVHHAVCDGFHTSRFITELQEHLNTGSFDTEK